MKPNLLVTLADENYIDQAKQLFSSVYWNAGWKGDYMLLAHEIPEKKLKWFRNKSILVKKCKPIMDLDFGRPSAALSKIFLFTTEFKKWKTVLYLDGDIIIKASLDKLTEVTSFAAIPDLGMPRLANQLFNIKLRDEYIYNELRKNFNFRSSAFNAGVFIFNTKIINPNTYDDLVKLITKYHQYGFVDQPILNLYFNHWQKLSHVYNLQMDYVSKAYNLKEINGAVLHFTCKNKPWISTQYFDEWNQNLQLAEKIDLSKLQIPRKTWTQIEIIKFNFLYTIKSIIHLLDNQIGKVGLFLQTRYPSLYKWLKKRI